MALYRRTDFVLDQEGRGVSGALVTVIDPNTGAPASIFSDDAGLVPLANPFLSDPVGKFSYVAQQGIYRETVSRPGYYDDTTEGVVVGVLTGPQGERGLQGPQGERGLQGPQGERGLSGAPGAPGADLSAANNWAAMQNFQYGLLAPVILDLNQIQGENLDIFGVQSVEIGPGGAALYDNGAGQLGINAPGGVLLDGTDLDVHGTIAQDGMPILPAFADTTDPLKNAGMVGFNAALAYAANTVGAFLKNLTTSVGASVIGFIQAGTGAVARFVQDKLREQISLFDYLSDVQKIDVLSYTYLLDVSDAVQKAITAANGRKILAPAGGYLIANSLTYFNLSGVAKVQGLKIEGEGIGNTIFKNAVVGGPMLDINTGVGATALSYFFSYSGILRGFTILGNASYANSDGIRFRSCWNYELDNVLIDSCTRYGIHIDNDTGINSDFTASANMQLNNVRIGGCKKGIYAPYGNGWPISRLTNVYIISCTNIGVECNSTSFQWVQGACAYNGTAYAGNGTPDPAYGGILIGSADNYVSKGVVLDGIELDDNHPQQVWMYNAKSPVIRQCAASSQITAGYINKYDFVFGRDSAATFCEDFQLINNTFRLPTTLAATGLTHRFVLTKAYVRRGVVDINGYLIAGGTTGTEIFYIQEDAKASPYNVAKHRTRIVAQNGDQTRAAYAVQYDGAMPISRLSMADDTAISLKPLADSGAILVSFNGTISNSAIILFSVSGGKTALMSSGSTGINISAVSLVLAGTTGTDAKATVSVDATTGRLYIENRLGGTVYLTAQIMEGFGDWL